MKLCLGTAQFGLDYGINNKNGQIKKKEVFDILNYAHNNGVDVLDTASAYGNSESILGEAIGSTGKNFKIITKYPANTEIGPFQFIYASLELLKTERVHGYLFHSYSVFQQQPDYINDFLKIKDMGKTEKIGFSLYYPSEAEYILKKNIPCDIVQIPYNIFDQRFLYLLPELADRGIEIYVRSVFLQGLFFIEPEKLDSYFISIKTMLQNLHNQAKSYSIDIAALCLGFVRSNQYITSIVIGIDSLSNLKENINNYNLLEKLNVPYGSFNKYAVNDENIILPFNWKK